MSLETIIHRQGKDYRVDLQKGYSMAIPLRHGSNNPKAWYVGDPSFIPVQGNGFIGHMAEGGSVNFFDVAFNPHGNGTHTECVGHIASEHTFLCDCPIQPIALCQVLSVEPTRLGDDLVITSDQVLPHLEADVQAIAIRTLPNDVDKLVRDYSNNNPAYFEAELLSQLATRNLQHFLTDLPSVDREEDGGILAAHHAWWHYPDQPRVAATITELIFIPDVVKDDVFLLNLMFPRFALDAAPSQPILYPLYLT